MIEIATVILWTLALRPLKKNGMENTWLLGMLILPHVLFLQFKYL